MNDTDTICAIATPPGIGGVGVVRVSGGLSRSIAQQLLGFEPQARKAHFARFLEENGQTLDSGIAILFAGPASFTGEDILELQGHGGPQVMQMLMRRVLSLGARPARPGEFSERAFLNNKLDLTQAEAIADLIESGTEAAARAAQRSLAGVFSDQVNRLQQELIDLRVFVEAAMDFPDEEIDFLADSDVLERLASASHHLQSLLQQAHQGQLLRDGIQIAITGLPNAGKSSLLNALAGRESAIVTDIPGTTRDVLREHISLDGVPAHIADTAGIRDSDDVVEAEGVRRARVALNEADLALLVIDATQPLLAQQALRSEIPNTIPCIEIYNKSDLTGDWQSAAADLVDNTAADAMPIAATNPDIDTDTDTDSENDTNTDTDSENDSDAGINATSKPTTQPARCVRVSAKTGQGLDSLIGMIKSSVGAANAGEGSFSARTRHLDALRKTLQHLEAGRDQLQQYNAPETLAEELRLAHLALGEITGEFLPDDLLGAIFSSFCIGK